jgi:hypothetical protein
MEDYTLVIVAVAVIAVVAAVALWMYSARRRREHLQERFGPEYHRAMGTAGSASAAEAALLDREKRVSKYKIRTLTAEERARFSNLWQHVQAQFVDDPGTAVGQADLLVTEVMTTRGYPMSDWEHRVEDLTVDHAGVVSHYRQGRDIASRHSRGEASTEDLRQALVHYRALFSELLEETPAAAAKRVN